MIQWIAQLMRVNTRTERTLDLLDKVSKQRDVAIEQREEYRTLVHEYRATLEQYRLTVRDLRIQLAYKEGELTTLRGED